MKVFLSSTAEDLTEYRKVADDTILRLAQESVIMERFGPRPEAPIEECERLARESDLVICIVGHRYGSIPENSGVSFTQREVETAHKAGKKILAWIIDDNYPWTGKTEQDLFLDPTVLGDPTREAEVKERINKLVHFKTWLRSTVIAESFTTADDLGRKIAVALQPWIPKHSAQPIQQEKVSIARLPTTGSDLFGREAELKILDDAWANPNVNVVSFVAWGGVGKTALVNHWLKHQLAGDNYKGAERVYGWSFFSQGTRELATSADLFIDQALRWFGDEDPSAGSPWDKGERLARYVRRSRTLLVLDGLEPLQHPPGPQEGRLKDAAIHALLVELAAHQPGLCIISTRARIRDLIEFQNSTVIQHDLDYLSPQAGARILRALNIEGEDNELEEAARELGGHAFSLTLLGSYLDEVLNRDVRRRKQIENLFDDTRYGDAAQAMIAAYEKWLGEGMELAILRLLGLFDRPADLASIEVLRDPPAIKGLTEALQNFKGREWNQAIGKLRRTKLLAEASPTQPGALDAHPLVREYFKQQLRAHNPDAWRDANSRLYEHLKKTAKDLPDTVEEMSPLYAAVIHGCAAGKYNEALMDVYWSRIGRGQLHFNQGMLGAFGADLSMLSSFFDEPWTTPSSHLTEFNKAFILGEAGADLRALGRVEESIEPMRAALEADIERKDWKFAGDVCENLSFTYSIVGDLKLALEFSEKNIRFADLSGDDVRKVEAQVSLAKSLHQLGRIDDAAAMFYKAEHATAQLAQPFVYPILYSVKGYEFCDLLLDQHRFTEVKDRAARTLASFQHAYPPLNVGLDYLSLGKAWLFIGDLLQAETFLDGAVNALRSAGHLEFLPLGLIARAMLHRLRNNYDRSERDLLEVLRIARRSSMNLHLADYHLESARLRYMQGNKEAARDHLATSKEMVNRMEYHRRDKEVAELEAQLG